MSAVRLEVGDCREVLARMKAGHQLVDAVCTDPPYHLASIVKRLGNPDSAPIQSGATGVYARSSAGFMGQQWDGGDVAFDPATWVAIAAVMKPGAYLVAFGGTRTIHRMTAAIEAAGFEIRDRLWNAIADDTHAQRFLDSLTGEQRDAFALAIEESRFGGELAWLFGTGFPKSHNLDGAHEGKGTALKPAHEPIVIARKPSSLPVPETVARYGTGAINIDECRLHAADAQGGAYTVRRLAPGASVNSNGAWKQDRVYQGESKPGRWPANVVHDGSDQVIETFAAYGERGAIAPVHRRSADKFRGVYGAFKGDVDEGGVTFQGDSGTADRFFYSAKATDGERVFRCRQCGQHRLGRPRCGHKDAQGVDDFHTHPTVKPIALMRWLVRLVCPPDGLVLDPFAGTGTTGAAALAEGRSALLIEQSEDYAADIAVRLGLTIEQAGAVDVAPLPSALDSHGPLFGGAAA